MTAMLIELRNGDDNVLSRITYQKAARLLSLEKAVIVEAHPIRKLGEWAYPIVMRLKRYIYIPYEKIHGAPRVSKRGVLLRDKHTCAYCGQSGANTIDHVHPRSRGGKNVWENLVAACTKCNHKKSNRTPEEAGMILRWNGYPPKRTELFG